MAHLSEESRRLTITLHRPENREDVTSAGAGFSDVCLVRLPVAEDLSGVSPLEGAADLVAGISRNLEVGATLIVFGDIADLVRLHPAVSEAMRYHLWVAIKRSPMILAPNAMALPNQHVGALVYTKYEGQLQHTKTRLAYTYCPACDKTTKDYGGKKHTYHSYGTLISDVWRDMVVDPNGDITAVLERFADLFGLDRYYELRVYDLSGLLGKRLRMIEPEARVELKAAAAPLQSQLINGDCLEALSSIPDNSVDFAFADPPYNLKKEYRGYADDLDIAAYFLWCDQWISEVARILRPGRTFALLNIPLWSIRHFQHLETVLRFQNWIVWDALSFPVRLIMPAHYTILCFTKGEARPLPGLTGGSGNVDIETDSLTFQTLAPLEEGFCLRASCVSRRLRRRVNDRGVLSDIWWDIHRLKHNTRRVDHPCQLPPQLMYRLIALFTQPGEVVLDCFNGAGTTTLSAHQLGRRFIGIEREEQYHQMALQRHHEIEQGIDPFRKADRVLTAKNSPVARVKKQRYEVPKKTLQLEVRRVARLLGKLPNRDEMIEHGSYPIRYYDEYFSSWGEVCAAARTTGMSEVRDNYPVTTYSQKRLF